MRLFRRRTNAPAERVPHTTIEEAMAAEAAAFVDAWGGDFVDEAGGGLDYSRASLSHVDGVLQEYYVRRTPLYERLHLMASAYFFETARREFGGRYLHGDGIDLFVLVIGDGESQIGVCAMSKVAGRAVNGPEDDLGFFYDGIAALKAAGRGGTLV